MVLGGVNCAILTRHMRRLPAAADSHLPQTFASRRTNHLSTQLESPSVRRGMKFEDLTRRIQPIEGLVRERWETHPNGGGWVERSAYVDPRAYVGPDAIVIDDAQIVGSSSKIDGKATIAGDAIIVDSVITDTARVGGSSKVIKSRVGGNSDLAGYTVLVRAKVVGLSQTPLSRDDRRRWMDTKISPARRRPRTSPQQGHGPSDTPKER